VMPRKKSNGIISKAIHGTFPKDLLEDIRFILFDCIPLKDWKVGYSDISTKERFDDTAKIVSNSSCINIEMVETKIVYSEAEALLHFNELYVKGFEGTVLKDNDSPWEGARSKFHIKFKGIITCDLRVIGYKEGTGKYKGMIGSLECISSDGLVTAMVSGLTDDLRKKPFEYWQDKIIEVYYNERIQDKNNKSVWRLFLPRFARERWDKLEADNINNIPKDGKERKK